MRRSLKKAIRGTARQAYPSSRLLQRSGSGGANFLLPRVAMNIATVQVGARSIKGKNFVTKEGRKAQWNPTRNIMTPMVTRSTPASATHATGPVHSAGPVISWRLSTITATAQAVRTRERSTESAMHESLWPLSPLDRSFLGRRFQYSLANMQVKTLVVF